MPKQPINPFPFVAGSSQSRSKNFDDQRTVNLYAEASGSGTSKTIAMLIGTPGLSIWASANGPPVRGLHAFNSQYSISVGGTDVSRIEAGAASFVTIGTIPYATTLVSMASNGTHVMLVTGAEGYFIDVAAGTMTQIADPAFVGADVVTLINGRFVWNRPGTQVYQWTEPFSTTLDALNFASAEGSPDLLVSLIADHKELWLLGETTTEVHVNSGNADSAFEAIQGVFIEQGCAAKFSLAKMTDGTGTGTILWLSRNEQGRGMAVRTVGYQPKRISTHAEEYQWAQYSRIDDAIAYTYQQEGHSFYVLTFPTANKTWCYDTSTDLWHERANHNSLTGALERHRSNCHMFFDGKTLVGDCTTDAIYEMSLNVYTDFGDQIVSIRQCPHLSADDTWQIFHELWLDMETGVGLIANVVPPFSGAAAGGLDPELILEWSDDGGHTFPYSRIIKIGKIGERKMRAVARRLGKSKDRVFRVTITAPVKRIFMGAGCRVSLGT